MKPKRQRRAVPVWPKAAILGVLGVLAVSSPAWAGSITNPRGLPLIKLAVYQGVVSIVPGAAGDSVMELGNAGRDIASSGDLYLRPGKSIADNGAKFYLTGGKTGLEVPGAIKLGGVTTHALGRLSADGAQAKRYEIARIGYVPDQWTDNSSVFVELRERYWGSGGYKKYEVRAGYLNERDIRLVEATGPKSTMPDVRAQIGSPVATGESMGGTHPAYYVPVYVDVDNYTAWEATISHAMGETANDLPKWAEVRPYPNPTGANVASFDEFDSIAQTLGSVCFPGGRCTVDIGSLAADGTQGKRYEIAQVGFQTEDWSNNSSVFVELHQKSWGTGGYKKYEVRAGYDPDPANREGLHLRLIDATGRPDATANTNVSVRVRLGPSRMAGVNGGRIDRYVPVYVDADFFTAWEVAVTHAMTEVAVNPVRGQVRIFRSPAGTNVSDELPADPNHTFLENDAITHSTSTAFTGTIGNSVAPDYRNSLSAYGNTSTSVLYAEQRGSGYAGYFSGKVNITGDLCFNGSTTDCRSTWAGLGGGSSNLDTVLGNGNTSGKNMAVGSTTTAEYSLAAYNNSNLTQPAGTHGKALYASQTGADKLGFAGYFNGPVTIKGAPKHDASATVPKASLEVENTSGTDSLLKGTAISALGGGSGYGNYAPGPAAVEAVTPGTGLASGVTFGLFAKAYNNTGTEYAGYFEGSVKKVGIGKTMNFANEVISGALAPDTGGGSGSKCTSVCADAGQTCIGGWMVSGGFGSPVNCETIAAPRYCLCL